MRQLIPIDFPAISADEQQTNFDRAVEWAEAVEKVESLKKAQRVAQLKQYAQGANVTLSVWAIRVLGTVYNDTPYLLRIADRPSLSIASQIAVDRMMMELDAESWRDSPKRDPIVAAWSEAALQDASAAPTIITRISEAVQRRDLDPRKAFEVLMRVIQGDVSLDVRRCAIHTLRWIINDASVGDDVVELLIGILEDDDDDVFKGTAAGSLRSLKSVSAEDMTRLALLRDTYAARALAAEEKDAVVKQIAKSLDDLVRELRDRAKQDASVDE